MKHFPLPEFRFSPEKFDYYFDGISYDAHEPGIVSSMVTDILRHFDMPPEHMNVKVEYVPEEAEPEGIGTYSQNDTLRGTVMIRIKPSYHYDTVISIAAHECAHHYLFHHNVKLEETRENERLTDIAVVYLGCGFYYRLGSDLGTEVSYSQNYIGQAVTTTTTHRLGYLKKEEFDFTYSEIKRIREAYEKEIIREKRQYRESAVQLLKEYESHIRRNVELVLSVRNIRLICENERHQRLARIFFNRQMENARQAYEAYMERLHKGMKMDEMKALCKSTKEKLELLRHENEFLSQCMQIAEFQSLLDEHVKAYISGISELAENGNVFAIYEKIKFYASSPGSVDDARELFEMIARQEDKDSFLVVGRCYLEGVGIEKNVDMAKYYYYNSWLKGSENAKTELDNLKDDE